MKCTLIARRVLYLEHVISEEGILTDLDKVKIVRNWPQPCNVSEVVSFLVSQDIINSLLKKSSL